MPFAAIFDVHGNALALDAVFAEIDAAGVAEVVCGGDVALFGPAPAACIDALRARRIGCVQGNTDRYLAEGRGDPAVAWTAGLLGAERLAWLAALPTRLAPRPDVLVVHATPRSDEEQLYPPPPLPGDDPPWPDTPDDLAAAMLADEPAPLVLGGHVHVQFARTLPDGRRFANPGSVGLPLDGDRRAAWALVHDDGAVELRRTAYDVEAVIRAVEASASPATELVTHRLREALP